MVVRKNISLEKIHLKKLEPLSEKHGSNLSAAIRDAIDITEVALQRYGSVEDAISNITSDKKELTSTEMSIDSGRNVLLATPVFSWMLKWTKGIPLDQEILEELLDPLKIGTISELDEQVNKISHESGWNCDVSIYSMDDINPSSATVSIKGNNEFHREFLAQLVVMFLVYNKGLDIDTIHKRALSLRIDLKERAKNTPAQGAKELFGSLMDALNEFKLREEFWKALINIYRSSNYNMVSLSKDQFEKILTGDIMPDVMIFESLSQKHIASIPHGDFLGLLKRTHESMLMVDKIDIFENNIQISHNYKNEKAIQKISDYYLSLLKENGHEYQAKYSMSLIILEHVCCRD